MGLKLSHAREYYARTLIHIHAIIYCGATSLSRLFLSLSLFSEPLQLFSPYLRDSIIDVTVIDEGWMEGHVERTGAYGPTMSRNSRDALIEFQVLYQICVLLQKIT